jgi:hypothetical protein
MWLAYGLVGTLLLIIVEISLAVIQQGQVPSRPSTWLKTWLQSLTFVQTGSGSEVSLDL